MVSCVPHPRFTLPGFAFSPTAVRTVATPGSRLASAVQSRAFNGNSRTVFSLTTALIVEFVVEEQFVEFVPVVEVVPVVVPGVAELLLVVPGTGVV